MKEPNYDNTLPLDTYVTKALNSTDAVAQRRVFASYCRLIVALGHEQPGHREALAAAIASVGATAFGVHLREEIEEADVPYHEVLDLAADLEVPPEFQQATWEQLAERVQSLPQ